MKINTLSLIDGAKKARGLTVIIDVFRAFSTECYVFANGAERVIPVGDIELARRIKKENPQFVLMGERGGIKPDDFDYGNSPTQVEEVDFSGKTVIHTTSSGTQGIASAENASEIISGGFVNAGAIVRYIKEQNPKEVSLVAMGAGGVEVSDEDEQGALYLENALLGADNDFLAIVEHLEKYKSAEKFFDPKKDWAPKRDFELCLDLDRFDFVLRLRRGGGEYNYFEKIKV